eukprot:6205937-Pleurochrysis_carterae.AAC.5
MRRARWDRRARALATGSCASGEGGAAATRHRTLARYRCAGISRLARLRNFAVAVVEPSRWRHVKAWRLKVDLVRARAN